MTLGKGEQLATPPFPSDEYQPIKPRERLKTPVNKHGLVDVPSMLRLVRRIHPAHTGESDLDRHHNYWPASGYPDKPNGPNIAHRFRHLPGNSILLLREDHEIIHNSFESPAVPEIEVMRHIIDEYEILISMLGAVQGVIRSNRRYEKSGNIQLHEGVSKCYTRFCDNIVRAEAIPPEFRRFEPSDYQPGSPDDLPGFYTDLGKLALRTPPYAHELAGPLTA